jgi:hypothetical protein
MEQPTILVVDDDPDVREILSRSLAALQYRVLTAESAPAALAVLGNSSCVRLGHSPRGSSFTPASIRGASVIAWGNKVSVIRRGCDGSPTPGTSGASRWLVRASGRRRCSIARRAPAQPRLPGGASELGGGTAAPRPSCRCAAARGRGALDLATAGSVGPGPGCIRAARPRGRRDRNASSREPGIRRPRPQHTARRPTDPRWI